MDPRLLRYYNRELQYLRELGGEFAKQFPKIAGRLGLDRGPVERQSQRPGAALADGRVEPLFQGADEVVIAPVFRQIGTRLSSEYLVTYRSLLGPLVEANVALAWRTAEYLAGEMRKGNV